MKKILLVDDQPHIIRVIKLTLDRKGFKVDTAVNGEEALEKLRDDDYDVLITDIEMPRMDGQRLCEAMHRQLTDLKLLTLVITAKTDQELRDWAVQLPQTEFLEKPLSLRRLTARLESYFATSQVAETS